MTLENDNLIRLCAICRTDKIDAYCPTCSRDTASLFSKILQDSITVTDSIRNRAKSSEKVRGKSKHEVEQYVGNKDPNVVSEFERTREVDKPTTVIHRLWRRFGHVFRNVHEHKKS